MCAAGIESVKGEVKANAGQKLIVQPKVSADYRYLEVLESTRWQQVLLSVDVHFN